MMESKSSGVPTSTFDHTVIIREILKLFGSVKENYLVGYKVETLMPN